MVRCAPAVKFFRQNSNPTFYLRRFYSNEEDTKLNSKKNISDTESEAGKFVEKVTPAVRSGPPSYFGYLSGVALTLWNSANWLGDLAKPTKTNAT